LITTVGKSTYTRAIKGIKTQKKCHRRESTKLLKWTEAHKKKFKSLEDILQKRQVLAFANKDDHLTMSTNASSALIEVA
jgi:uncharacterized protein with FMN-binding domain